MGLEVEGRGTFGDDERLSHCKCAGAGLDFLRERVSGGARGRRVVREKKQVRSLLRRATVYFDPDSRTSVSPLSPSHITAWNHQNVSRARARAHTEPHHVKRTLTVGARASRPNRLLRTTPDHHRRQEDLRARHPSSSDQTGGEQQLRPLSLSSRRAAADASAPDPPDRRRAKRCSAGRSSSSSC